MVLTLFLYVLVVAFSKLLSLQQLGADSLRHHNLLADIRNQRLIEADTFSGISCSISSTNHLALVEPTSNKFRKVLNEFPDLLKPTFSTAVDKHGVQHFIPTKDQPVFARARRLAPEKLKIAKAEFLEMGKMGIIQKSSSPWASALYIWCRNKMAVGAHAPSKTSLNLQRSKAYKNFWA